jgi:hypothetical protein
MEEPMLTADRLKIFNELVGLCKAQLPLVKPTDLHTGRHWTIADLELYDQRSERIAKLQRQFVESRTANVVELKAIRMVPIGSWGDR